MCIFIDHVVIQFLALNTSLRLASKGNHIHSDTTFKPSTSTGKPKEENMDM